MKLLTRNCTFAIGGKDDYYPNLHSVEVIASNDFYLPYNLPTLNLPIYLADHSSVVTNENELLIIGGLSWFGRYIRGTDHSHDFDCGTYEPLKSNLILQGTKWVTHSVLLQPRYRPISICMPNGIYVFGGKEITSEGTSLSGIDCLTSSEFLANGSLEWQTGPKLPTGAEFMDGGDGVAISETELVLMGGFVTTHKEYHEDGKDNRTYYDGYESNQIWKFNTITEEWHLIGNLKIARINHKAAYLNGKVIVSGGVSFQNLEAINSTEIFDPHHDNVEPNIVGDLNVSRYRHGIGTILENGTPKIIVFGGFGGENNPECLDSIEKWDPDKKEWKLLQQKLSVGRMI